MHKRIRTSIVSISLATILISTAWILFGLPASTYRKSDQSSAGKNTYQPGDTDKILLPFISMQSNDATDIQASSLVTPANWTGELNIANSYLGHSVNSAGDVNGDGYDDVIVSAIGMMDTFNYLGKVLVYHGSATGLGVSPAWSSVGAWGHGDYGWSVSTAGDVNGDGYDDIIIGQIRYNGHNGRVYLFYGSPTGLASSPAWTYEGYLSSGELGWSVSTAGDVNSDGFSDIVVGVPGKSQAYLFYGSVSGLSSQQDRILYGEQAGDRFGHSTSLAGDINADGYDDIVIGAPYHIESSSVQTGKIYVYFGSSDGIENSPSWTMIGDVAAFSLFGWAVSHAGDVNNDGYADIIASAKSYYYAGVGSVGKAYAFYGTSNGLPSSPSWEVWGDINDYNQRSMEFGISLDAAGDINGDGFDDIVVGARGALISQGKAYAYYGSASGLATTHSCGNAGSQDNSEFGHAVASAGDVNNDGYADIVVGAPRYDNPENNEGLAYAYHGAPDPLVGLEIHVTEPVIPGATINFSYTLVSGTPSSTQWAIVPDLTAYPITSNQPAFSATLPLRYFVELTVTNPISTLSTSEVFTVTSP
ncbi:MAG: integrin alpha [Chloroflexota bacterium]